MTRRRGASARAVGPLVIVAVLATAPAASAGALRGAPASRSAPSLTVVQPVSATVRTLLPARRGVAAGGPAGSARVAGPATGQLSDPRTDPPTPVFGPGTPLPQARRWLNEALTARLARLSLLSGIVATSTTLDPGDQATLSALLSSVRSGLSTLASSAGLPPRGSLDQANAEASQIIGYRVYSVVVPKVLLVVDGDSIGSRAGHLRSLEGPVETAITAATRSAASGARAAMAFARYSADVGRAGTEAGAATANALAATAPGPAALSELARARTADAVARSSIVAAKLDLRELVKLLSTPGLRPLAGRRTT